MSYKIFVCQHVKKNSEMNAGKDTEHLFGVKDRQEKIKLPFFLGYFFNSLMPKIDKIKGV